MSAPTLDDIAAVIQTNFVNNVLEQATTVNFGALIVQQAMTCGNQRPGSNGSGSTRTIEDIYKDTAYEGRLKVRVTVTTDSSGIKVLALIGEVRHAKLYEWYTRPPRSA